MKAKTIISEILMVVATMIWGLGFTFQSIGGASIDVFTLTFFRSVVASVFLGLIVLGIFIYKKVKNIPQDEDKKSLFLGGFLIGLSLVTAMGLQQVGINLEGAGKSGFITALYVVFVPIASLFFGKKLNIFVVIAIVFALTGLYLINVSDNQFTFTWGTAALIGCALTYTVQIMLIDYFSKKCDVIKLSLLQFSTATIISLPFMLIFGNSTMEGLKDAIPSILYLGIGSSGVAFTLQIVTQKHVNVTIASIIMSLESVFAIIFALIILHEQHTYLQYIGCGTIFIAVILSQLPTPKRKEKPIQ